MVNPIWGLWAFGNLSDSNFSLLLMWVIPGGDGWGCVVPTQQRPCLSPEWLLCASDPRTAKHDGSD